MGQHVLAEVDDTAEFLGRYGSVGELDRGFDTGEREAFHSVTVELQIAHLGAEEGALHGLGVVVLGEELAVLAMVFLEEVLVVPEGVVGVECNGLDAAHGVARDLGFEDELQIVLARYATEE